MSGQAVSRPRRLLRPRVPVFVFPLGTAECFIIDSCTRNRFSRERALHAGDPPGDPPLAEPPQTLRRILHIEDSETDAFIVKRGLRALPGLVIDWAPTAGEGLALAAKNDYDLILLDYALPDMSGLDALLKLTSGRREMRVVIVSGFGSEYVAARGLHLGAIGYVNKDTSEFKDHLADILLQLHEEGLSRARAKAVEELVRQKPTLRHRLEDVLTDLRDVLPEARGTFLSSVDGLPLAVSHSGAEKDVDVLSAMACASVVKDLDVIGGSLHLDRHHGGLVHYDQGSLLFHRVENVGAVVVVLDRSGTWRGDGREVEQAAREIEGVLAA